MAVPLETGEGCRDRALDEVAIDVPRDREDQSLRSDVGLVERDEVPPCDPAHAAGVRLRVPPVRMALREDRLREGAHRTVPRVVRLDAEVVENLPADALDLLRGERGSPETFDEEPDGLRGRLPRAPALEREDLLRRVELEGRADPLEAVRELRRARAPRPTEQEPRGELCDTPVLALRRDARGHAPAEREERVRREGDRHEDGTVAEDRPVGQAHADASCAWKRTTLRRSSTRWRAAARRTSSGFTFSTRASTPSAASQEESASITVIIIP